MVSPSRPTSAMAATSRAARDGAPLVNKTRTAADSLLHSKPRASSSIGMARDSGDSGAETVAGGGSDRDALDSVEAEAEGDDDSLDLSSNSDEGVQPFPLQQELDKMMSSRPGGYSPRVGREMSVSVKSSFHEQDNASPFMTHILVALQQQQDKNEYHGEKRSGVAITAKSPVERESLSRGSSRPKRPLARPASGGTAGVASGHPRPLPPRFPTAGGLGSERPAASESPRVRQTAGPANSLQAARTRDTTPAKVPPSEASVAKPSAPVTASTHHITSTVRTTVDGRGVSSDALSIGSRGSSNRSVSRDRPHNPTSARRVHPFYSRL